MGILRFPVPGTNKINIDVGRRLHNVPFSTVEARLLTDLDQHYNGDWYACVMASNGRGVLIGSTALTTKPPNDVVDRMIRIAVMANREIHHGGHWVVSWHNHEICALWRDGGGDAHFHYKWDDTWVDAKKESVERYVQGCENAWVLGVLELALLEIKPEQTYHRALGEPPPTRH